MELELVLLEELLKSGCELAAEDAAECTDGQEESVGDSEGTNLSSYRRPLSQLATSNCA